MSITTTTAELIELATDPRFIAWYCSIPGAAPSVAHASSTEDQRIAVRELAEHYPAVVRDRLAELIELAHAEAIAEDIARVWDEAHAEHRSRATSAGLAELAESMGVDTKAEQAARELQATPEQLARLRVLVQAERDAVRLARETAELQAERDTLRAEVSRLQYDDIERYDPRIRPMLQDLAQLAQERSFCSEFDLVLDHIGAPTRAELAPPRTSGHHHVSVTLRVNIDVDNIHEDGVDRLDILRYVRDIGLEEDDISDVTVDDSCLDD